MPLNVLSTPIPFGNYMELHGSEEIIVINFFHLIENIKGPLINKIELLFEQTLSFPGYFYFE